MGYEGGYDAVRRHAVRCAKEREAASPAKAHIPLSCDLCDAYQFDWSQEDVVLGGKAVRAEVAHVRLCHSRMFHVRAYLRESHEMVFDAHGKAFAFFGGACAHGNYDNMRTAITTSLRAAAVMTTLCGFPSFRSRSAKIFRFGLWFEATSAS